MDSENTCIALLRCESEQEVQSVVEATPEMSDTTNWQPIDERDSNFNVVTNQASTGSKALAEMCTNMVDAVLMKHAFEQNVPLTGPDAPQSVLEGVRQLVALEGTLTGRLADADSDRPLREFATENLVVGVTGGTRRDESLCFTFVDNGEGQHSGDFQDTFLSLSRGNKTEIPFVQGRYSMGSSGVLSYCGDHWYKLIISKRFTRDGNWGWTLVRRRPTSGTPIAEYFHLQNEIQEFDAHQIWPLMLGSGQLDEAVAPRSGSIIKLYDYQMETRNISFRDIRESMNLNLVSTVLPIRLMDYRYRADPSRGGRRAQGVDERSLFGIEYLLLKSHAHEVDLRDDDEETVQGDRNHVGRINDPYLGRIDISVIVLPRELPGWLKPNRTRARVFHSVNGQVQFTDGRNYVSAQCRLPGLKDRVVLIVDASDLTEAAYNDVWKGDRESIRQTRRGAQYVDAVTQVIRNSQYLKDLQHQLREEELDNVVSRGSTELFQSLVNEDPNVAQLLPYGELVTTPRGPRPGPQEYVGQFSPSFLRLVGRRLRDDGIDIAVGGTRRVTFETDVVNDYFYRPDNRGDVLTSRGLSTLGYDCSLSNGRLVVNFSCANDHNLIGNTLTGRVGLTDDAMLQPIFENVNFNVLAERQPSPPGTSRPRRQVIDAPDVDPPQTQWMTRDGRLIDDAETEPWPEDYDDQDGGQVTDLGEEVKLYSINYDNAHFMNFLARQPNELSRRVATEQYRLAMLVSMLSIEDAFNRMESSPNKTELEEHIDEIRRLHAQSSATIVMTLTRTLPEIVNPSAIEDPDDS